MDYQQTLNLPKTDFSMKAGLVQKEPAMLEAWKKMNLYDKIRAKSEGNPSFILHDGPPYANGHIHIGHALNKILKDVIVKYKTMQGFDSKYIPGWDCHGLPIEHALLKELKAKKTDLDCVAFRKKAHDYAMKFVGIQREEFERLGIMGEWDNPYLTLTPGYEHWILKSLAQLVEKDYIYRSLKPVNWCFSCETALAEAEVEYENHVSPTVFVRFPVNNPEAIKALPVGKKVSLLVWTTTPWTLLANVAVAVNADFEYVMADLGDEILIVEKTLAYKVLGKVFGEELDDGYKLIGEIKGEKLTKLVYTHPFGKKEDCPVVKADYVTREDGTGLVHTAPGHGQDDYQTGLKNHLPILMPVNDKGVFTDEGSPFEGQHVFKANPKILADLADRKLLFYHEELSHSYPHCWRCKSPIISRATYQWFLKIDHQDLRTKLKTVVANDVEWFPAAGQERIKAMLETRPDWCLSRQRYWGVPIPAVKIKGSDEQYLLPEVVLHVADLVKEHGSNVWFERDLKDLLPEDFRSPTGDIDDLEKTNDILDVWFDSGVSHRAVFHEMLKKDLPADLYLEGSDQHRGWFQSSLIPSVALDGKAPYRQVLTHGFVVDGEGRKMSKSLGNVIAPKDFITQSGVDILRLWVASSNYHDDIRLSKEVMARLIDAYRKIRNTSRYILSSLDGFDPSKNCVDIKNLLLFDRWALSRLATLIQKATKAFEAYDFAEVYKAIHVFCNEDLSSVYLDILKDRLYTSSADSLKRRSAQTVLYHMADVLARLLAPVLCFTADEIFLHMPKEDRFKDVESVHLLEWPKCPQGWLDKKMEEKLALLTQMRPAVLKALEDRRKDGGIGSSLQARVVIQTSSKRDSEYLKGLAIYLPSFFIVSDVIVEEVESVTDAIGGVFAHTAVKVEKAEGEKCPRCWNFKADIGTDQDYLDVCRRCAKAIKALDVTDVV